MLNLFTGKIYTEDFDDLAIEIILHRFSRILWPKISKIHLKTYFYGFSKKTEKQQF